MAGLSREVSLADILRYWYILRQRAWLMLLCLVVSSLLGWAYASAQPPRYEATTSLLINPAAPTPSIAFLDQSVQGGLDSVGSLVATYTEYLRSKTFTQKAVEELHIAGSAGDVAQAIMTARVPNTNVFKISITWNSPEEARRIANGIADLFISERLGSNTPAQEEQQQSLQYYQRQVDQLRAQSTAVQNSTGLSAAEKEAELARIHMLLLPLEEIYIKWSQSAAADRNAKRAQATAAVLDRASSGGPAAFPLWRIVFFAAMAGLALGVGVALMLDSLDDTVKTPEDVVRLVGLPTLGNLMRLPPTDADSGGNLMRLPPTNADSALISRQSLNIPAVEAYRMLWTNIQFATVDKPARMIVISSWGPQEGKTTTLANLAVTMARAGTRVLAVDTDLRRPSLHKIFGLSNASGMTNLLLREDMPADQVIQPSGIDNLSVLTSGPLPPNPAELLGSSRFLAVAEQLKTKADLILFDSPPISAVVDPVVLADRVGYALLVVEAGKTRSQNLASAQASLAPSSATVLGVIVNKINRQGSSYYYYYSADPAAYGPDVSHDPDHTLNVTTNGTEPQGSAEERTSNHSRTRYQGILNRALTAIGLRRR